MFRLIEQLRQEPRETLDLILSHAHLDHVMGLTFLLDICAVTSLKRVRVFGLSDKLLAVREHLFSAHLFPIWPAIELVPLDDLTQPVSLECNASMSWFPLEHPGGSIGVRIQTRKGALAYVTDTVARADSPYLAHLHGLKLLLHECYFSDGQEELAVKTGHSWLSAVTEVVRRVRPERTALIHINPLTEVLQTPLLLNDEQRELGMFVAKDLDCINV